MYKGTNVHGTPVFERLCWPFVFPYWILKESIDMGKLCNMMLISGGSRISNMGVPIPKVGTPTYYLANFFLENCMKMEEIGPRVGVSDAPWIRQC